MGMYRNPETGDYEVSYNPQTNPTDRDATYGAEKPTVERPEGLPVNAPGAAAGTAKPLDWSWLTNFWKDITGQTAANIQAESVLAATATQAAAETTAADTLATASTDAGATQAAAAQLAIDEQKRQFEAMQEILRPWVEQGNTALEGLKPYEAAGTDALSRQRALMGLDGPAAQEAAMQGISGSPEMTGMVQQGENALLQQGAATGGLRGGNIQGALAQFRPQMLSGLINQQYSKLGGLIDMGQGITMNRASLGQASAAGLAAGGMANASSLGNLFSQQGNAIAGGQFGAGQALATGASNVGTATAQGQLALGQVNANNYNLGMQPLKDIGQLLAALGIKAATGGF